MPEIILHGCTPEPLMSYLKALGVLRLVAEQPDPEARGAWRGGTFVVSSQLDENAMRQFFLEQYSPTPIVAPWGARSGFYPGSSESSARAALHAIRDTRIKRLELFQSVLKIVQDVLVDLGFTAKVRDEDKIKLLQACRARLPDSVLSWLDATYVLTQDDRVFPPLLGTGGNEGSGSYVSGFAQQVVSVLIQREWDHALNPSLFQKVAKGIASKQTPGHFSPRSAGGPNATQGFDGETATNPWDYLLTLEGACLWACGFSRRFGTNVSGMATFPFTTQPSAVGHGTLSFSDGKKPKNAKREIAEMWLPLWEKPTSLSEVQHLLSEGRATVGKRVVRTGVDFARAIAGLGTDRGVESFQRMAFLMRNGQNFMAVPLGRFEVRAQRDVGLLQKVDTWLDSFRRACRRETPSAPPRFTDALRRIDTAIFDFCRYGGKQRMREILCALGEAERELASGERFRNEGRVNPIPPLSPDWITACDDGSLEYRLALSLAAVRGDRERHVGDIRVNLESVERQRSRWIWAEKSRAVVWSSADLCRNMIAVLARRVMDAGRGGVEDLPLDSRVNVSLADVSRFLSGETDDRRIEELLWGLLLIDGEQNWREPIGQLTAPPRHPLVLPHAYALLKLLFLPHGLRSSSGGEKIPIKPEPEILSRLRATDVEGACTIAARRLRAAGLVPMPGPSAVGLRRHINVGSHLPAVRLAAALLFPINDPTRLGRQALRPPADERVETSP